MKMGRCRNMKYKYEFEVDETFQKGCCFDCPLAYFDPEDDFDIRCPLNAKYNECPLEEVKE